MDFLGTGTRSCTRHLLWLGGSVYFIEGGSCERRNISAIIRPRGSGEARCSVNEQTMEGD